MNNVTTFGFKSLKTAPIHQLIGLNLLKSFSHPCFSSLFLLDRPFILFYTLTIQKQNLIKFRVIFEGRKWPN